MVEKNIQLQINKSDCRFLSDDARVLFERGAERMECDDFSGACEALKAAYEIAPEHARLRSLLGVAIAHHDHAFEKARELCESAAKQEFFNPDLYLNLARIHLLFGFRSEAIRYLRRGQMIDPGSQTITSELARLGRRGTPIIPFLPRKHPINRALGEARSLLKSGLSKRLAA